MPDAINIKLQDIHFSKKYLLDLFSLAVKFLFVIMFDERVNFSHKHFNFVAIELVSGYKSNHLIKSNKLHSQDVTLKPN